MKVARADVPPLHVSTELTARYFRALGDPTRLRILELLVARPRTVTDLVRELGCSQSRVSNHIGCLRWCDFVSSRAEGKWTYYSVTERKLHRIIELGRALVAANADHIAACTRIREA